MENTIETIYLPIVKPEVAGPIGKELSEVKNDKEYIKKVMKKLDKENPIVAMWIKNYAKKTKDKIGSAYCAVMVYRMLESQSEADCMNAELI